MTHLTRLSTHGWNGNKVDSDRCVRCGEAVDARRWALGIHLCMRCGEAQSRKVVRCIVPLHKSNYILVTDLEDLKGINNKGGFYR
jgi:hypothetical protein